MQLKYNIRAQTTPAGEGRSAQSGEQGALSSTWSTGLFRGHCFQDEETHLTSLTKENRPGD